MQRLKGQAVPGRPDNLADPSTRAEPATPGEAPTGQRRYWSFFWPLALMGLAMLLQRQFQNRALAGYADAKRELATYALALSTFMIFRAALIFVPQMVNVLARSARSRRLCLTFTFAACLAMTVPLAVLALTRPGEWALRQVFRIDGPKLAPVVRYIRFFLPLVFLVGLSQFYTGLLIQAKRTGIVTSIQVVRLVAVVTMLVTGWELGWDPVLTLSLSLLVPAFMHLGLSFVIHLFAYAPPEEPERETLEWGAMLHFFWPVALTSVMFSFSRPIIYSFLTRLPDGEAAIAALAVAFSFAMIFHSPVNRFRDLFITFGREDREGVRRFMLKVMAVVVGLMLVMTATPLIRVCLRHLLNVKGDILKMAAQTFWPLCLIPVVITFRNYYHGLAMVERHTGGMAAGGVARNIVILIAGLGLFRLELLNHVTAASVLALGFLTEATVVLLFTRLRRLSTEQAGGGEETLRTEP